jgi:hypothetical protein
MSRRIDVDAHLFLGLILSEPGTAPHRTVWRVGLVLSEHLTISRSVCRKSFPVHSSGRPASRQVASVRQSPKFSAAGWRPLP